MLLDFVGKFKAPTVSGPHEAEPEPALGKSSSPPAPAPLAEPPPASPVPQSISRHSVLGLDVEIKGSVKFSHDLLIDGRVEGDICSDGKLTVGEHAVIKGEIKTRSVIIFGNIEGNITTQERCELRNTATLIGNVAAGTVTIDEGATFIGQSRIGNRQNVSKSAPDHADKPLGILSGTLSAEMPAQPAAVITTRQAA